MVPWIYHAPRGRKKIGIKRSRHIFGTKLGIINDRLFIINSVSQNIKILFFIFLLIQNITDTYRRIFLFQISSWVHAHENQSIRGLLHFRSIQQTFWNCSKDDPILPTKQFAHSWSRTYPPSHSIRRRVIVISFIFL